MNRQRSGLQTDLPASVGKQTAVERQANVAKVIFGPLEWIFWKKAVRVTWRTGRKIWVKTRKRKPKSVHLQYCPASLESQKCGTIKETMILVWRISERLQNVTELRGWDGQWVTPTVAQLCGSTWGMDGSQDRQTGGAARDRQIDGEKLVVYCFARGQGNSGQGTVLLKLISHREDLWHFDHSPSCLTCCCWLERICPTFLMELLPTTHTHTFSDTASVAKPTAWGSVGTEG